MFVGDSGCAGTRRIIQGSGEPSGKTYQDGARTRRGCGKNSSTEDKRKAWDVVDPSSDINLESLFTTKKQKLNATEASEMDRME